MSVSSGAMPPDATEWTWLRWLLPDGVPAYASVWKRLRSSTFLGNGRRGVEHLLFGDANATADADEVPPPVFAFGVLHFEGRRVAVTVHEESEGIIAVQIGPRASELSGGVELRRWSYSTWRPGQDSPELSARVRTVEVDDDRVLALCAEERRLWLHTHSTGHNHLLPATALHRRVMQARGERDAALLLRPERLFTDNAQLDNATLLEAFRLYAVASGRVAPPTREGSTAPSLIRSILEKIRRHA